MLATMTDERLLWHLWNWEQWHYKGQTGDVGRGWPTLAGSGVGQTQSRDFDSMCASVDDHCARAVEATLDDCTPVERAAVHHFHLRAVFRFPRIGRGAELAYEAAKEKLRAGLTKRGIV